MLHLFGDQVGVDVYRQREEGTERAQFDIGDDEDEPPSYDDISPGPAKEDDLTARKEDQDRGVPSGGKDDEMEMEVVEVKHPVSRSDSLLSIARKYAADVSSLFIYRSTASHLFI